MLVILSEIIVAVFFVFGLYCAVKELCRLAGRLYKKRPMRKNKQGKEKAPPAEGQRKTGAFDK